MSSGGKKGNKGRECGRRSSDKVVRETLAQALLAILFLVAMETIA